MMLGTTRDDVVQKAKQLEEEAFRRNKSLLSQISALPSVVEDVYNLRRPTSHDYLRRGDLIRIFNIIAKEAYGNQEGSPTVEAFGSFLMNMFSSNSDLDLSINFKENTHDFPQQRQIETLRKFARKFNSLQRKGHVTKVRAILTARVPVLKVTDCGTGIECDVSVENRDGIAKSQIVRMISAIDERFQKLCFMVKAWAKAHDINSSKDGTLNSLSLISLVAFHLQRQDPPILPPFSAIFQDGTDPATVNTAIPKFLNYGRGNNESLAELFVTFLIRLASVKTLWAEGLCASAYQGSWIKQTWPKKLGCITVEDFTIRSLNIARSLLLAHMSKIYQCIHDSIHHIHAFVDGKLDASRLTDFLFGPADNVKYQGIRKFDHIESEQPAADPAKRIKLVEGVHTNAGSTSSGKVDEDTGIPPSMRLRYESLARGNSSRGTTSSSKRNRNERRTNGHIPLANAREKRQHYTRDYGKSWIPVNPHLTGTPPMASLHSNSPDAPFPTHMIPLHSVPPPRLMMFRPNPYPEAPLLYPRSVNTDYVLHNPNQ